ncbi:MAG: 2-oxo acid dehydrogenase subunit E2 [Caldilinea sp.]|nr:2-oxo acid dehydrogenase subunit E2 [Caldilinea sp.]MDW8440624.1 2-oxo acid dehydrogenase subunit E2 [Caldilineaceae bacterium]
MGGRDVAQYPDFLVAPLPTGVSAHTRMTNDIHRGIPVKRRTSLTRVRRMMVQSMEESVRRAALGQVTREMDLSAVQAARAAAGARRRSVNTYVLAAVARALPNHPLLNAELVENTIVTFDAVNLGMAVATPDGLVVTVIHGADQRSLDDLETAANDLATRARTGKLKLPDIEGGTFTVSNLGMYGIDGGFPLPRPPEGAILLVGRMREQPAIVNGQLTQRPMAWFSLAFDHRFIDGAAAAAFLQEVQERLTEVAGS